MGRDNTLDRSPVYNWTPTHTDSHRGSMKSLWMTLMCFLDCGENPLLEKTCKIYTAMPSVMWGNSDETDIYWCEIATGFVFIFAHSMDDSAEKPEKRHQSSSKAFHRTAAALKINQCFSLISEREPPDVHPDISLVCRCGHTLTVTMTMAACSNAIIPFFFNFGDFVVILCINTCRILASLVSCSVYFCCMTVTVCFWESESGKQGRPELRWPSTAGSPKATCPLIILLACSEIDTGSVQFANRAWAVAVHTLHCQQNTHTQQVRRANVAADADAGASLHPSHAVVIPVC